jgi:hypothetical protein
LAKAAHKEEAITLNLSVVASGDSVRVPLGAAEREALQHRAVS